MTKIEGDIAKSVFTSKLHPPIEDSVGSVLDGADGAVNSVVDGADDATDNVADFTSGAVGDTDNGTTLHQIPDEILKRMANVQIEEFEYPSWDDHSMVHGCLWLPAPVQAPTSQTSILQNAITRDTSISSRAATTAAQPPKAIIQLIHGMSEHISRYDQFARYLAANGFAVFGHDHIGHGYSAFSEEELGHMPPETGADILVEDVDTLRHIAHGIFPGDLPYFMFGHSMGSFTLRVYLTRHGAGLAGAIICGTGNEPIALATVGNALARVGARFRGETSKSNLIHSLVDGAFVRQIDDPETEFDWISVDRDNIDEFLADDLNGFQFTYGGYASLTKLALLAANLDLAKQIPEDLPILLVSGSEDPVGNKGDGVIETSNLLIKAGVRDVQMILYEGMRHEILNETGHATVFHDILDWILDRM